MKPLLVIEDLHVSCGAKPLIKNIHFSIQQGESVGLVGESGSGKSLTASAIIRLLPEKADVTAGSILFEGENLLSKSNKEMESIRGRLMGLILQDPMTSLNPVLTIGEQLIEGIRHHLNFSKAQAKEKALDLLSQMGIRDPLLRYSHYPHELSGGQRQRVLIAIALSCHPRLLIADEPTTALDATVQSQLLSLLKEKQQLNQMGLLFISHDLNVIAQVCERVIVLKNGEIVEQGSVEQILNHPTHPYTQILVNSKRSLQTKSKLHASIQTTPPLLRVKNVRKTFQKGSLQINAINDVSLNIEAGKTVGLAGESGCGKSTLGKCISKLLEVDQGSIEFCDQDITHFTNRSMIPVRRHLQIIFQNPYASLNPRMAISKILLEPLEIHQLFQGKAALNRVEELMEWVGLYSSLLQRYPSQLSGGQRQRIAIARALAVEPKLIICDEILSSLDATTQMEIIKLLQTLQQQLGISYLFISHDLPIMGHLADRIAVMHDGEIVENGTSEQILLYPSHPYTKTLIQACG